MSAGAPTFSVPRSLSEKIRDGFTVAHSITWDSGIPTIRNFDITLGQSMTPVVRLMEFPSVDSVSGQKPVFTI